jgi:hypothetical protein
VGGVSVRTERDADPKPEAAADAGVTGEVLERIARMARDLEWLQKRYGRPQPRDPQRGQLGLPIDGGDAERPDAEPEGADA